MCITPVSFPRFRFGLEGWNALNPTQWLCKNVSDGGSNWTARTVKNNYTNIHQWNMSMSTMTNWPCPPCPRAPCPYILVINCQKSGCQYFSWKFQMGILFIYGNKFCDLKTLPRSIMSTKKQQIIGVGNLDIPGYQDSPPQDCPLGGQSWGGESWGYSYFALQRTKTFISFNVIYCNHLLFLL